MWMAEIYVIGVLVGLMATQGGALARIGFALLWPLGPLAFPMFGVILAAVIGAAWWFLR